MHFAVSKLLTLAFAIVALKRTSSLIPISTGACSQGLRPFFNEVRAIA